MSAESFPAFQPAESARTPADSRVLRLLNGDYPIRIELNERSDFGLVEVGFYDHEEPQRAAWTGFLDAAERRAFAEKLRALAAELERA